MVWPVISNADMPGCHNNFRFNGGHKTICTNQACPHVKSCLFSREEVMVVHDVVIKR